MIQYDVTIGYLDNFMVFHIVQSKYLECSADRRIWSSKGIQQKVAQITGVFGKLVARFLV